QGEPFFALAQHDLVNGRYLTYLRAMYGNQIYIPTAQDSQTASQQYADDFQRRREHDRKFPKEPRQLKPGENLPTEDERAPVGGIMGQLAIRGLLTKLIFDRNPDRKFYVEESFPLDWMYPHLVPHGLILQIQRKAQTTLSPKMVSTDREFWSQQQR